MHHAEVLVYVLNAATRQRWDADLEIEVLFAMTYTVVIFSTIPNLSPKLTYPTQLFSSILNPSISLNPWFPEILKLYNIRKSAFKADPENVKLDSDEFLVTQEFGLLPSQDSCHDLPNFARIVITLQSPEVHIQEIRELYKLVKNDCESIRTALEDTVKLFPSKPFDSNDTSILHNQLQFMFKYCQTSYSIILCFGLLMSAILQACDPADAVLALETDFYTEEIIQLAGRMNKYRPLGATFAPVGLSAVFAISRDQTKRGRALNLLTEYSTDFKGMRWMDSAEWFNCVFDELRARLQTRAYHGPDESSPYSTEGSQVSAWTSHPPPNGSCFIQ